MMAGVILDVMDPKEVLGNLTFSHRLDDFWSIASSGRLVFSSNEDSLLNGLDESHSLEISLKRYF